MTPHTQWQKDWAESPKCQQLPWRHQSHLHQTKNDQETSSKTCQSCSYAHYIICKPCSSYVQVLKRLDCPVKSVHKRQQPGKKQRTCWHCAGQVKIENRFLIDWMYSIWHPTPCNIHSSTGDVHLLMTHAAPIRPYCVCIRQKPFWSFGIQAGKLGWYILSPPCGRHTKVVLMPCSLLLVETVPSRAFVEGQCRAESKSPC